MCTSALVVSRPHSIHALQIRNVGNTVIILIATLTSVWYPGTVLKLSVYSSMQLLNSCVLTNQIFTNFNACKEGALWFLTGYRDKMNIELQGSHFPSLRNSQLHSATRHSTSTSSTPRHGLPPQVGSGLEQVLVLFIIPRAHVLEQGPSSHSDQLPGTNRDSIKTLI